MMNKSFLLHSNNTHFHSYIYLYAGHGLSMYHYTIDHSYISYVLWYDNIRYTGNAMHVGGKQYMRFNYFC